MSATLFTAGKFQAFYPTGANGSAAPLAGGLLYSYAAGTTTAQATYTDQSGLTANANPVVLDSNGQANVWLTGNYKFVLTDPLGNQLWSEDNISDTLFSSAFSATSTTSNSIGIGSKTWIIQSGKSLNNGQYVIFNETSNTLNFMSGPITSYTGTSITVNVQNIGVATPGALGPFTDWTLSISGVGATDQTLGISDNTTNNVSINAHGFAPKLPNNALVYLNGAGTYTTPPTFTPDTGSVAGVVGYVPASNVGDAAAHRLFRADGIFINQSTRRVSSLTISSSTASVSFNNLIAGYQYVIRVSGLYTSSAASLYGQLSVNNGSSFISTSNAYTTYQQGFSTTASYSGGASTLFYIGACGTTATTSYTGKIELEDANNAALLTSIRAMGYYAGSYITSSQRAVAEADNAIQIYPSTGTISAGVFELWEMAPG